MEPILDDLFLIDTAIAEIDETQADVDYENSALSIISTMHERLEIADVKSTMFTPNLSNIKLPRISLPTFDGTYENWTTFRDTFMSLIHNNESLTPVEKFYYLKASLIAEAAKLIESLEVSDINYDVAWTTIVDRFDNDKQIIKNHTNALLKLPFVNKYNIRETLDTVMKNIRALEACNQPVHSWGTLLIAIILAKFDFKLNEEWETYAADFRMPSFEDLKNFMDRKSKIIEAINGVPHEKQNRARKEIKKSFVASKKVVKCLICSLNHEIYSCPKFLSFTPEQRFEAAKTKRLCINCLKEGHKAIDCKSSNCRSCDSKHNSLLHFVTKTCNSQISANKAETSISSIERKPVGNGETGASTGLQATSGSQIILSTAIVHINDKHGQPHSCRALLDSGSESNFITENLAQKLQLGETKVQIPVIGINGIEKIINKTVFAEVSSHTCNFKFEAEFLVIKNIGSRLPTQSITKRSFKIPPHLQLADPQFNLSNPIDLLLGAEIFYELLEPENLKRINHPMLQNTKLGWIVSGKLQTKVKTKSLVCNFVELNAQLQKFWEVEEVTDVKHNFTNDELYCENHFKNTYSRNSSGRFVVELPLKQPSSILGNSKTVASNRLASMERKFRKNSKLGNEYAEFMTEYLKLGHMKQVHEIDDAKQAQFYLPHHAVCKEDSLTTKLRVVFDASAKSTTGFSLNDILYVGPTIQQDLFSLITRFRTHKYALTADIAKMYRQVLVKPEQTTLQKILWRFNTSDTIKAWALLTLTYGTATASFLAIRCLHELAAIEKHNFPIGSGTIIRDFYVDDLITGANSVEDAIQLRNEVSTILSKGCFELRKWASNDSRILDGIENEEMPNTLIKFDNNSTIKTLGIGWNPVPAVFTYSRVDIAEDENFTKRKMLSEIAKLFDPLGLISPITIRGKIIIQQLWQLKVGWDEVIESSIRTSWNDFLHSIRGLNELKIKRHALCESQSNRIELHGFCDASNTAYGACIYLRSVGSDDQITCNLLCSKARVAPLKQLTIPRLELCGALLLAKLVNAVTATINLNFESIYLWTDSMIVLAWLKSESKLFQTFVANRISQIQSITTSSHWYHVKTNDNPADILSRGASIKSLINNNLWWHGPHWLISDRSEWVNSESLLPLALPEQKRCVNISTKVQKSFIFERFSSFNLMIRVISYCKRFINNCKNKELKMSNKYLSVEEINDTRILLIKLVQAECFSAELETLSKNNEVGKSSKTCRLSPFMSHGLIRVGGRLKHSNLKYSIKFPILLPSDHAFTSLLISHVHLTHFHAGPLATLAILRESYWVLNARTKIKAILHKCFTCFRAKPKTIEYKMGDLPSDRVTQARPFSKTAIDYGGPIFIKQGNYKSKRLVKAYIALFVCLSSRAVHIELVTDLTTNSFLAALKRLMARRGKIHQIFSDNATNFKGAAHELHELYNYFHNETISELIEATANQNIKWHFIPPNSPHFGGLWEAGIKAVKFHLKRVVKNASLTYEELYTLLVQIEAILNSRPLTPISEDPSDFSALTPAHLLIGDTLMSNAEPNICDLQQSRLSRWQYLEQIRQHFWQRWSKEYVANLQERTKWQRNFGKGVALGQLVILREDNLPPLQWAVGRIVKLHPGEDKVVRVVPVRTSRGDYKRATKRICVLPIDEQD